jgi:hypothetical protein
MIKVPLFIVLSIQNLNLDREFPRGFSCIGQESKTGAFPMNFSYLLRRNEPFFMRGIFFLICVQVLTGILFFGICPAAAATDLPPATEPRLAWMKTVGPTLEGGFFSVISADDGGSVSAGCQGPSTGVTSIYLVKTDTHGNVMWEVTDPVHSTGRCSFIETSEKGYLVSGSSNTSSGNGIFLQKYDPSGKKVLTQEYKKGEYYSGSAVSTTRDGGLVLAGSVFRIDNPQLTFWDGYIIKTDTEGRELWTGFFNGEKNDFISFINQTEDGGYILAGTTESYGPSEGQHPFLLKMNEFGNKEWFTAFESSHGNEKLTVIQTPYGGYVLLGSPLSDPTKQQYPDLFLIGTDDRGKELWKKNYSGIIEASGTLFPREAESSIIIAGSIKGFQPEKTGQLVVIDLDLNGNERRNQTFNIGQSVNVQDIAFILKGGYFVAGLQSLPGDPQKNRMAVGKIIDATPYDSGVPVKNSFDLSVITKEALNGTHIGGVQVYLDGKSAGTTSDTEGKHVLREVERGTHTLRVAKSGYEELTRPITVTEKRQVSFTLNQSKVIPLQIKGSTDEKIDIVFVASGTSFNCNTKTKIQTAVYSGDQRRFIADVQDKIGTVFLTLDTITSGSVGIPKDFRERFNFYYYWDSANFADAFDGCSGTLPADFWNDAPFSDVAIILYPTYEGYYTGSPCEPNGCANGLGPGSGSWLKAPADSPMIFLHESGHVVFGLIDTYCGETYYVENTPFPNVWSSESSCKKNAEQAGWDSASCRQIFKPAGSRSKEPCLKNFWKADSDPDIMGSGAYSGRFGIASTSRIRYIFDTINRWQK